MELKGSNLVEEESSCCRMTLLISRVCVSRVLLVMEIAIFALEKTEEDSLLFTLQQAIA